MGRRTKKPRGHAPIPSIQVSALGPAPVRWNYDDGEKFAGGYGATRINITDYWTLRARSSELFETNLYARGLIRRLVTNIINTGLHLECAPEEKILGLEDDDLADWSEDVENRFGLWSKEPWLCDHHERLSFGAIQSAAYMEALIDGDVLAVLRQDPNTRLTRVQLIKGSCVRSPMQAPRNGNRIEHGVELDAQDRQVAYWITQRDGTSKRLPAYGEKSGRRLAWLVYATDKRLDQVRGKPILSLVLQSMKEIDRYRDSTQRKATVNSIFVAAVERSTPGASTKPVTGGAIRAGTMPARDDGGTPRRFAAAEHIPGAVIEELQVGETFKPMGSAGTDERFGDFETAIIKAIAWAHEIPPEILMLAFGKNYAGSQAAINEFKMYLNRVRTRFGEEFCQPIYVEWLISAVLSQKINADGLIESWRNWKQYDAFCAWTSADWSGHIKPAVDLSKLVEGYAAMVREGFIDRDRATRELTGMKHSKVAKKLKRENAGLAEAREPLEKLMRTVTPTGALPTLDDDEETDEESDDDNADARVRSALIRPIGMVA